MIVLLQGELYELTAGYAIIFVNGIGYQVQISLETYNELLGIWNSPSSASKLCQVYTCNVYRSDALPAMVAFSREAEKKVFQNLIKIHGVGTNTALMIINGLGLGPLIELAENPNEAGFRRIKGVGPSMSKQLTIDAEKITYGITEQDIEYLEKVSLSKNLTPQNVLSHVETEIEKDAVAALVALGLSVTSAKKTVKSVLAQSPGLTVQDIIKRSLQSK